MKKTELKIRLKEYFNEQCIPEDTRGYYYLMRMCECEIENGPIKIGDMCRALGVQNNVTPEYVKRQIERTITKANYIRKQQGQAKLTPKTLIVMCANYFVEIR